MSGPKKTKYEIKKNRLESIRQHQIQAKKNNIYGMLKEINNEIGNLLLEYGYKANYVKVRVDDWVKDAENNCRNGNLRAASNGINGIRNYIDKEVEKIRARQHQIQAKKDNIYGMLEEINNEIGNLLLEYGDMANYIKVRVDDWIKDAENNCRNGKFKAAEMDIDHIKEYIYEHSVKVKIKFENNNKINKILNNLISFKKNYPEVMNEGILKRMDLYASALKSNPDNRQTIDQIKKLEEYISSEIKKYEMRQLEFDYISDVFSNILGSNPSRSKDGTVEIKGEISGAPITVRINRNNKELRLDTPTDGSCKKVMADLSVKLEKHNISLGPIKVVNTGEVIGNKDYNNINLSNKNLNA